MRVESLSSNVARTARGFIARGFVARGFVARGFVAIVVLAVVAARGLVEAAPARIYAPAAAAAAARDAAPESAATAASADGAEADGTGMDPAAVEAEIAALEISDEARDRLDAARESVVQIRGFAGNAESSTFHGTGFAVDDGQHIVTNYHVVAPVVLYPRQYRLEYVSSDGRKGRLRVLAIDVPHDLAVVAADDLELPSLRVRHEIPAQGSRAWSIGFPLNLGLTITEGVVNGVVEDSIPEKIHYTGALNAGMSGGPALDRRGRVYGINVSVIAGQQLIAFIVPAHRIAPLLDLARTPLDTNASAQQRRLLVTSQVRAYESDVLGSASDTSGARRLRGYAVPTRMVRSVRCGAVLERVPQSGVQATSIDCGMPARITVQNGVQVVGLSLQHQVLRSRGLHRLQFERRVNVLASGVRRTGLASVVAPFACRNALVALDGFDARVSTCVRQYRLFSDLYDFDVTVVGIDESRQALLSHLALQGVSFATGMRMLQRFTSELHWTP